MATLEKTVVPGNIDEIPGLADLGLIKAILTKNPLAGLPLYIIRDAGTIVAAAAVDPDGYPLYAKLWCIEVAETHRRKGIGSLIIRRILEDYDDLKLVAVRAAFGFYRRIGFAFLPGREPDPRSNVGYMVSLV